MLLTDKDIEHVAKLARIKLLPKEIPEIREKLSSIFSYIEQLNNVNTDNVVPFSQSINTSSSLREDAGYDNASKDGLRLSLLNQAPKITNDFVKVGSVLGRSKK